jgi:NADH:ubiquinone oxidoreductase subunit B-like Fe-S oxidoreductase
LACCGIEMIAPSTGSFDIARSNFRSPAPPYTIY